MFFLDESPLLPHKKRTGLKPILFFMRKKGLEKFSYPRNPVNKEDAASTALGYLIKYLIFLISTSITRYAIHKPESATGVYILLILKP